MAERTHIAFAFHQTAPRFVPGINNLHPGNFFAVLSLLESQGVCWQKDGAEAGSITGLITFDDAYDDNFEVMLAMAKRRIPTLLFVPGDYIGRKNRWDYLGRISPSRHLDAARIRELSEAGIIVGSHGAAHRALTTLSPQKMRDDLRRSKETLGTITGKKVTALSPPFGRINRQVANIAHEIGFTTCYTMGEILPELPVDIQIIPRLAVYANDDFYSIKSKLEWFIQSGHPGWRNRIINLLSAGSIITSR